MRHETAEAALRATAGEPGPLALLFCEDAPFSEASAARLFEIGCPAALALGPGALGLAPRPGLSVAPAPAHDPVARAALVERAAALREGRWLLVLFNGELPFLPHGETRGLRDFTDFLASERRRSAVAYAVDLYADAMIARPEEAPAEAWFDAIGWYGFDLDGGDAEVRGGLGWRFEERTPPELAVVNRPALFRAAPGLRVRPDLRLEPAELNALAAPWHRSPTFALMSWRRTRRVLAHPASRGARTLIWPGSARFEGSSAQLLRLGVIEPGQWA